MKPMIEGVRPARALRALAWLDALERAVCIACNRGLAREQVRLFFAFFSRLGDGVLWYVLMGTLALTYGSHGQLAALQMGLTALVGVGVYKLLKHHLVRERPYVAHAVIRCGERPLDRYSFPSGHTLQAVLFTSIASAWFPELAGVLIGVVLLIAASRVVLGLHYPSDVLAGALIGWALAKASLRVVVPLQ